MRAFAKARSFLVALFRRRRTEEHLDDELRYHLELQIEENIRLGMPPREARFAAQRLLGNVAVLKEECRDAWGISFFETLNRDFRYAVNLFRRTPLFTLMALATLAVGIGANATIFTVIENIILHPLPVRESSRLQILSSVLARTILLGSAGAVTGAILSLPAGKMLSSVLYGVSARDPATYLFALLIVAGVAVLACWSPVLRAIRIDPARTLRDE